MQLKSAVIFILMKLNALGRLLKARRKALGIDQRSLSELVGVAVHTISDIESGKGNPTVATLTKLCGSLGLELTIQVRTLDPTEPDAGRGD